MSLPKFDYMEPPTLAEATAGAGEDMAFVSGGTDLFVRMKARLHTPSRLVGLRSIDQLKNIGLNKEGELRIGAVATLTEIAANPLVQAQARWLCDAIELTASPLLRNAATLGGNLCQESRCSHYNQPPIFRKRWGLCFKLGGKVCHVAKGSDTCHAVYAGDLAGPLMAAGAMVTLVGAKSSRSVRVADLFTGSGLRPIRLAADEILAEVCIPALPERSGVCYQKLRLRDAVDYPLAGVSARLTLDRRGPGAHCRDVCLVLNAVGPAPVLVEAAADELNGHEPTPERLVAAARIVQQQAHPFANAASSPAYRRQMVPWLARRALTIALEHASQSCPGPARRC